MVDETKSPNSASREAPPTRLWLDADGNAAVDPSFLRYSNRTDGTSMASRIARRRVQKSSETSWSPKDCISPWGRTLEDWRRDIAPSRPEDAATPDDSVVSGPGLDKAVVGSLAQFSIIAKNNQGQQVSEGGDHFVVTMRGRGSVQRSQPALVRTKLIDRGDGSYMCEYRPWLTGNFSISVALHGCPVGSSPFEVSVITLRPDPCKCVVRGEALKSAIARTPMKFEILFVDAMGHPAIAEEVDVFIEPNKPGSSSSASPSTSPASARPNTSGSGDNNVASNVTVPADAGAAQGVLTTEPAEPLVLSARPSSPPRSARSGQISYDAPSRQRHMQLWQSRMTADKLKAKGSDGGGEAASKKEKYEPTSFAHEMNIDPLGFAFGGVDPGTLHAHGKLVKVHSVHYSVGLAGEYKLHVGLRQQMAPLPGSPFHLVVEPGYAYPASSKLPAASLPLKGVADQEWQHGLTFVTADILGNACTRGGGKLTMKLSKNKDEHEAAPVEFSIIDNNNGTYELKWKSTKAGAYHVDVLMDGAHVGGSPINLTVRSASPAVEQMEVRGLGMTKAVAGEKAGLLLRVADRFGNKFESGSQVFPYKLGLMLSPFGVQGTDKAADKKVKMAEKKPEGDAKRQKGVVREEEKKQVSLPFEGRMNGSVYEIDYVAQEAGTMDLQIWATKLDDVGAEDTREMLPGSPFTVHVSEGNAAAEGSFVGDVEASKEGGGFVAGGHVVLRPQIRDQFGNASAAAEGTLSAYHVWNLKPEMVGGEPEEELSAPKASKELGKYELVVEPTKAGLHHVHIRLHGQDISGSPVSFSVTPAGPASSKCKLNRTQPPEDEPLMEKSPIAILVTLFDKFGNQLDRGGIRVDAKASGVGVSPAKVEDNKDGTYTVTMTAGPAGEIKVIVRIDGNDLAPMILTAQKPREEEEANEADAKDSAVDAQESAPASDPKGSGKDKAGGKDDKKAKDDRPLMVKDIPWMPPPALRLLAEDYLGQAAKVDGEAERLHTTFEMKLGSAILAKLGTVGKIQDLIRDWDKNGDGDINKIEFRQVVTGRDLKSLGLKADNKDIDSFFQGMDADGGGSLELAELKPALKTLQERSAIADREAARLRTFRDALRQRAEEAKKLAEVGEVVEAEEKILSEGGVGPSATVDVKIGAAIMKKNIKIGEAVSKWDKDGDGTVNTVEFVENVKEMGVEANSNDVRALFDSMDGDGGGTLDLNEVKKCFNELLKT